MRNTPKTRARSAATADVVRPDVPPPANVEAEKCALGSAILDPDCFHTLAAQLRPEDFYDDANQALFSHMMRLSAEGKPIDTTLLVDSLKASGDYDLVGGMAYIGELFQAVPHAANARYYAEIVSDASQKRRQIEVCQAGIRAALNGQSADVATSEFRKRVESIPRQTAGAGLFPVVASKQFSATSYSQRYLVEGVVVEGQPGVIGGIQKTLKTSVAIDLALSLAFGGHFLGRFNAHEQRRVLFMSAESGMGTIQETAVRIADAMGRRLDEADVQWCDQVPRLDDACHLDGIQELFRREEIQVAIFDPAYLMLGNAADNVSNIFAQGRVLGNLNRICIERGVTPILLHHLRKSGDPTAIPTLADLAFSGFAEFFRWWVLLARRTPYQPGTGQHNLWASFGGSAGHSSLHAVDIEEGVRTATEQRSWGVTIQSANDVRHEAERRKEEAKEASRRDRDADLRNRVLRIMHEYPDGCTRNAIRAWCGLNSANAGRIINQLLDGEQLVPCEVTLPNRKKPYEGVTLSAAERERLDKLAACDGATIPDSFTDDF